MKAAVEAERTQNIQLASSGTSTAEKGILLPECNLFKKDRWFWDFELFTDSELRINPPI